MDNETQIKDFVINEFASHPRVSTSVIDEDGDVHIAFLEGTRYKLILEAI